MSDEAGLKAFSAGLPVAVRRECLCAGRLR